MAIQGVERLTGLPAAPCGRRTGGYRGPGDLIRVLVLGAAIHLGLAATAEAMQASARIVIGATVGPRAVALVDRPAVRLAPGEAAVVMVTVKARLVRGSAAEVVLRTVPPTDGAAVTWEFAGGSGQVGGETRLGGVSRSGIHTLPLRLRLAPTATAPVTLPLALGVAIEGAPLLVAGSTDVRP